MQDPSEKICGQEALVQVSMQVSNAVVAVIEQGAFKTAPSHTIKLKYRGKNEGTRRPEISQQATHLTA